LLVFYFDFDFLFRFTAYVFLYAASLKSTMYHPKIDPRSRMEKELIANSQLAELFKYDWSIFFSFELSISSIVNTRL